MHIPFRTTAFVAAFLALGATADIASAQTRLQAGPRTTAPAATTAIANRPIAGAPSASGLASPFPASLTPPAVPGTSAAGTTATSTMVTEGTANTTANTATGTATSTNTNTPGNTTATTTDVQANTSVMGAGPYGTRGIVRQAASAGVITNVDIARSFLNADLNRDGELSRAEGTRLTIAPFSYEEMDANHDDRLTRSEYEAALQ